MASNQLYGFPFQTSQMDVSKSKISINGTLVDLDTAVGATAAGVASITSGTIDNVSIGATTKASSVNSSRFASDAASGQTQINYASAADSISKAMVWLRARIFGDVTTADALFPSRISPFRLSLTDNARSTSGVGVSAFHVQHVASGSGTTTGVDETREAANFRLQVQGQYGDSGYIAFCPMQTVAFSTTNQGGITGWTTADTVDSYYRGGMFGGCTTAWLASGSTFWRGLTGFEVDWGAYSGSSVFAKKGLALVKDALDVVAGTGVDCGINIAAAGSGTAPIGIGIQFGDQVSYWPFDSTSTLIGAKRRGQGIASVASPEATVAADYGVDLREVTISTAAFASTGFKVDGSGRVTLTVRGSYANDAAAAAGSVAVGEVYRNGSALMIRVS